MELRFKLHLMEHQNFFVFFKKRQDDIERESGCIILYISEHRGTFSHVDVHVNNMSICA